MSRNDPFSALLSGLITLMFLSALLPGLMGIISATKQINYDAIKRQIETQYQQELRDKELQIQYLNKTVNELRKMLFNITQEYERLQKEKVTKADLKQIYSLLLLIQADINNLNFRLKNVGETYVTLNTIMKNTYNVTFLSLSLYLSISLLSFALLSYDIISVALGNKPVISTAVGKFLKSIVKKFRKRRVKKNEL